MNVKIQIYFWNERPMNYVFLYLEKKKTYLTKDFILIYTSNIIHCLLEIENKGNHGFKTKLRYKVSPFELWALLIVIWSLFCLFFQVYGPKHCFFYYLLCSCSVSPAKWYNILCPLFLASHVTPDPTNAACRHTWNGTFPKVIRHLLPLASRPGRSHFKVTHTARSLSMGAVCRSDLLSQTASSWLLYPKRSMLPPAVT